MPRKHRQLAVFGVGLVTALLVSGCGGGSKFIAGGSPPGGGPAGTPGSTVTGAATAHSTTKPTTTGATVRCTVSSLELLHVLSTNASMYQALGRPAKFGAPVCVADFAMAGSVPPKGIARVQVLFKYDSKTKSWTVLAGGSGVDCSAYLSEAQAQVLPGCD